MHNVWPTSGEDGIDRDTPQRVWQLADGDLIVMHGDTQRHWHHRVPKAKSRRPRININFRYIIPGSADAERGQSTYYKYCVHGDGEFGQPGSTYDQILQSTGSLLRFTAMPSIAGASTGAQPQLQPPPQPPEQPLPQQQQQSCVMSNLFEEPAEEDAAEWACEECTLLILRWRRCVVCAMPEGRCQLNQ